MRRIVEWIGLTALAVMLWNTGQALYGPHPLPESIPTRFSLLGHPVAWSSPTILLLPPVITGLLYLLLSVVARYPEHFNYPVEVTEGNRRHLQMLALELLTVLKLEVVYSFVFVQQAYILAARYTHGLPVALLPTLLVVFIGTVAWYVIAMLKADEHTVDPN